MESIVIVTFREPPLAEWPNRTAFYFGSLSAIYDVFTPEQIGCKLCTLWNSNITAERPYRNKLCEVSREALTRKPQSAPNRKQKFVGH